MAEFNIGSVVAHIQADISDFQSGMVKAQDKIGLFGKDINSVSKTLEKAILIGSAAAIAIGGIFGKQSIEAAATAQAELIKFNTIIENSKNPTDALKKSILEAAAATTKLGFDDEAVAISIARFYQRTGDLTQSLRLNQIAMDLSRDKNMDLVTAQQMVGLVLSGNGRALKQYGIDLKESATPMEAVLELQNKVAGSSEAFSKSYAGSLQVMNEEFTNLKETVGNVFLPVLTQFMTSIGDVIQRIIDWENETHTIEDALNTAKDAVGAVTDFLAEHKTQVEVVVGILTGFFLPALIAVTIQMGTHLVLAVVNSTLSVINFGIEGWKAIAMLIMKSIQLGIATAAFILHTAVTIAQTAATVAVTAATWLLNAALAVLTSPIFLVVAAIVALIAIGYLLIKNWDAVKAFGKSMLDWLTDRFWDFVNMLKGWGGKVIDAIRGPFDDAWHYVEGIMKKIKDALDFTKKHSPSVVDIVTRGVGQVNNALEKLAFNTTITPNAAAVAVSGNTQSSMINQIRVDMNGAMIGDEYGAREMGQKIGDEIIKKLQLNVRF